jgi:protoporphyrinogen oxidase
MTNKIIIVGGGIAGLYTGIELLKRGYLVTILEKYPYIGGRCTTFKKPDDGIQWEIGAGRIHKSHRLVLRLLKKYKLQTFPINSEMNFIENNGTMRSNKFTSYIDLLKPISELPQEVLANNTLETLTSIMGFDWIWREFPYNAEVATLRADLGLKAFLDGEMKDNDEFFVIREGFGELIARMLTEFKKLGGKVNTSVEVIELVSSINANNQKNNDIVSIRAIEHSKKESASSISIKPKNKNNAKEITANKIIFACHALGLQRIIGLREIPSVSYVKMRPLVRIYAKFPLGANRKVWFNGVPKTVTTTLIRYFIPVSADSAMISYTDAVYADDIIAEVDAGKEEEVKKKIMDDLRAVFADREIPDPLRVRIFAWSEGASYWLPGEYSPEKVSEQIQQPMPNVYICGESYSLRQAWVEGALENAEQLLKKIK